MDQYQVQKIKTKGTNTHVQIEITNNSKSHSFSVSDWTHLNREVCSFFRLKEKALKYWLHDGKRVDNTTLLENGLKLVATEGPFVKPIPTSSVLPETFDKFFSVPPSQLRHGAVHILPFLYLGSLYTAREESYLKSLQITHVLNATHDLSNMFPSSFTYFNIPVQDRETTNIFSYFSESNQCIESARTVGGIILVHCRGGVSRSVTLILAYLIWKYQFTVKKALQYLKERKPSVAPNPGFLDQLRKYEFRVD